MVRNVKLEKLTRIEEWDNLSDDKGENPSRHQDTSPRTPSHHSVAVDMLRVSEQAEENEARSHRCIQTPQENDGRNHERERRLLINQVERAKCWRSHVLIAGVGVYNRADDTEDENLGNSAGPE